jgi:hypothetical protein
MLGTEAGHDPSFPALYDCQPAVKKARGMHSLLHVRTLFPLSYRILVRELDDDQDVPISTFSLSQTPVQREMQL